MRQASVAEKPTTMYSRNMTVGERPQGAAGPATGAGACAALLLLTSTLGDGPRTPTSVVVTDIGEATDGVVGGQ